MRNTRHLSFCLLAVWGGLATSAVGQMTLTKIYSFTDHDSPLKNCGLVESPDGKLYGWSGQAGADRRSLLFRINKDGSEYAVLHTFTGLAQAGENPSGLVYGKDDRLYGVAYDQQGLGRVFSVAVNGGDYQELKQFNAVTDSTADPFGLMEATDGMLYGLTGGGSPKGTLYRIGKTGSDFQILQRFPATPGTNAQFPRGIVLEGPDHRLYGVTASDRTAFLGIVYRINPDGSGFETLHRFAGNGQGSLPDTGLIYASDGFLYGQAQSGGTANVGGVFKLRLDGSDYQFLEGIRGGVPPYVGVAESGDGYLYGATTDGGPNFTGILFRMRRDGTGLESLHEFSSTVEPPEGTNPRQILHAKDGFLYFVTYLRSPNPIAGLTAYRQFLMRYGPVPLLGPPADAALTIIPSIVRVGQTTEFRLAFMGQAGRQYQIQFTDSLTPNWLPAQTITPDPQGRVEFTDDTVDTQGSRFFRVVTE